MLILQVTDWQKKLHHNCSAGILFSFVTYIAFIFTELVVENIQTSWFKVYWKKWWRKNVAFCYSTAEKTAANLSTVAVTKSFLTAAKKLYSEK